MTEDEEKDQGDEMESHSSAQSVIPSTTAGQNV